VAYQYPYIEKTVTDHVDTVLAHDHNKQEEQIDAVTVILGLKPQGTYADIQARLDDLKFILLSSDEPKQVQAGNAPDPGTEETASRVDHSHGVATADTPEISTSDATDSSAGSSPNLVRGDHKHKVATGIPGDISDLALAPGVSDELSRADHVHSHGKRAGGELHALVTRQIPGFMDPRDKVKLAGIADGATSTPLANSNPSPVEAGSTASPGTVASAARIDHRHKVETAKDADLAPATAGPAGAGISLKIPRADHKHHVSVAFPAKQVPGPGKEGDSCSLSRADHVHPMDATQVGPHAPTHEKGGHDQVDVDGLSGILADPQKIRIQEEGATVGEHPILNFIGPGVTAAEDPANNRVNITIPGSGSAGYIAVFTQVAGEALAAGDPVYKDPVTGKWFRSRADTLIKMPTDGVAPANVSMNFSFDPVICGRVAGLSFAAADVGKTVFVDVAGGLTVNSPVTVSGRSLQEVGYVSAMGDLIVELGRRSTLVL
jgi:hypothetical protein